MSEPMDTSAQYRYAIACAEEHELTARLKRVRREKVALHGHMTRHVKDNGGRLNYDLLGGQRVTLVYDEIDNTVTPYIGRLRGDG